MNRRRCTNLFFPPHPSRTKRRDLPCRNLPHRPFRELRRANFLTVNLADFGKILENWFFQLHCAGYAELSTVRRLKLPKPKRQAAKASLRNRRRANKSSDYYFQKEVFRR